MARSQASMEVGLTKAEVISRLGEPDSVAFIQISFRPPDDGEKNDHYQRALAQWKAYAVGELWTYNRIELRVRISKAGQVVDWSVSEMKSRLSTQSGLVRIEPEPSES